MHSTQRKEKEMKNYIFKTTVTMKDYNNKFWWIDAGIVRDIHMSAENMREALEQYRETVAEKNYIEISNTAIKNKSAMYQDTADGEAVQVGYVITGKTEFQRDYGKCVNQYIDLWVTVLTTITTEF